ncbi:MAG: sulfite exporter TauE/SafE family protein [Curvibacter sp.]|nr:sulfite exporter TauE/SafE family protein [Curvibacter sp.]
MGLTLLLGALVGAVLGLTGAGGGMLAVPALVVGLHWSMQQAAPVALIAVAFGAAVGAVEGLRRGLVRYRAAVCMALSGIPFSSLGQWLAHRLSQQVLLLAFSLLMLWVAQRLWRQARAGQEARLLPTRLGLIDPATGRFLWSPATLGLVAGIGALTGFMTGLLGVGGGFVIVPLLRRFTRLPMQGIVATSLLVIALVGGGAVLNAWWRGQPFPAQETLLFSGATALGMLAGRRAAAHLSARQVQQGFALVLAGVALGLMLKALTSGP